MDKYQEFVSLWNKLEEFVKRERQKPMVMFQPGPSLPTELEGRIFCFNAGRGMSAKDQDLLLIGIEEIIDKVDYMTCHIYVEKDTPTAPGANYPQPTHPSVREYTIDELAALLTGLDIYLNPEKQSAPETTHISNTTKH